MATKTDYPTPLLRYLEVQDGFERDVRVMLERSYAEADRALKALEGDEAIGRSISRSQIRSAQREINNEMDKLFDGVGDSVRVRRAQAAQAAVDAVNDPLRPMLERAGLKGDDVDAMIRSQKATAVRGVENAVSRVTLTKVPLSERVWHSRVLASGQLDNIINSAIARGASAAELAKAVRPFINPNVAGGTSYAAKRLGRTELNNAFHGTQIQNAVKNPFILSMEWNLSGSHPRPDLCNDYAGGGDMPDGSWNTANVPGKPHPNCLCFLTPVTPTDADMLKNMQQGKYDEWLGETLEDYVPDTLTTETFKAIRTLSQEAVLRATGREVALTRQMKGLVEPSGGEMAGLDFAVKGWESLARKVADDVAAGKGTPGEVIDKLYDINRYTAVFDDAAYARKAHEVIDELRSTGHTVNVKNYWQVGDNPYQGVNVQAISKTGQRFELQFHTPRSLAIKEGEAHHIYEIIRVTTDPRKVELLTKEAFEVSRKIPVPPRILEVDLEEVRARAALLRGKGARIPDGEYKVGSVRYKYVDDQLVNVDSPFAVWKTYTDDSAIRALIEPKLKAAAAQAKQRTTWKAQRTPKYIIDDLAEQTRKLDNEDLLQTLEEYVNDGAFMEINRYHRGFARLKDADNPFASFQEGEVDAGWVRQFTADMDEAISKQRTMSEMTLYRGVDSTAIEHLKRGETFKDDGYISSSLDPAVIEDFGDAFMRITYPAGRPALYVDALENISLDQAEVILPRGLRMKVTSIREIDGRRVINVTAF